MTVEKMASVRSIAPDLDPAALAAAGRPGRMSAPELAIHALAQLPPGSRVALPDRNHGGESTGPSLRTIAAAYGLESEVDQSSAPGSVGFSVEGREEAVSSAVFEHLTLGQIVEWLAAEESSRSDDMRAGLVGERVLVVTNHPAHYRLPLFERLSDRLGTAGATLSVLFTDVGDSSRQWLAGTPCFSHSFVSGVRVPVRDRPPRVPVGLGRAVSQSRPSVVVVAGFSPAVVLPVARAARACGAALGVWSGETPELACGRPAVLRAFRRRFVSKLDFAVAYGHRSAEYLRQLRADLPLVIGRNTAPVEPRDAPARHTSDPLRLVAIGDLASPRKGVDVALDIVALLSGEPIELTVIGGGRLEGDLRRRAGSDARIRFTGALSPADVRSQLARSHVLIFPTRADIFGLVLVEGMGAGLAPITSSAAGAVDDVAVNGLNALVVPDHDPAAWATAVSSVLHDESRRRELGIQAAATIRRRWTIDHSVDAMISAVRLGAAVRERGNR